MEHGRLDGFGRARRRRAFEVLATVLGAVVQARDTDDFAQQPLLDASTESRRAPARIRSLGCDRGRATRIADSGKHNFTKHGKPTALPRLGSE